jgi:hypothetical protein
MANWYLAPSLVVLRNEVNTRWPNRDKRSDGTIGDAAHQNTDSDHNPNSRESVDAWDMDKDGVNVDEIISAFQEHPSANYWIYNRVIADADNGWRRIRYTGTNPHTEHVHFSIRQSSQAEQNEQSWGLLEDEDMTPLQDKRLQASDARLAALVSGKTSHTTSWSDANPTGTEPIVPNVKIAELETKVAALATQLNVLENKDYVDEAAIAVAVINELQGASISEVVSVLQGIFSPEQIAAIKAAL